MHIQITVYVACPGVSDNDVSGWFRNVETQV
jgi:hypothetical protein